MNRAPKEVYHAHSIIRKYNRKKYREKYSQLIKKNSDCRIAVVLHLYYEKSWVEIKEYLKNLNCYHFDLFITTPKGNLSEKIILDILNFKKNTKLIYCPNQGYDLGPFFKVLNELDLNNYDVVFKLQSKSTKRRWIYIYKQLFLRRDWFLNLFEGILSPKNVHFTINKIYGSSKVGLVAAQNLLVTDPLHKQHIIKNMARDLGDKFTENYQFVAGTCFAAKAKSLKGIQKKHIQMDDFENTLESSGMTYAHYIERYICCSILQEGYDIEGNKSYSTVRTLLRPLRRILNHFSSERLLENHISINDQFFLKYLDNRLIKWKFQKIQLNKLKIERNYQRYSVIATNKEVNPFKRENRNNNYIIVDGHNVILNGEEKIQYFVDSNMGKDSLEVLKIYRLSLKDTIKFLLPLKIKMHYLRQYKG